jgi:hypothetical protein
MGTDITNTYIHMYQHMDFCDNVVDIFIMNSNIDILDMNAIFKQWKH